VSAFYVYALYSADVQGPFFL